MTKRAIEENWKSSQENAYQIPIAIREAARYGELVVFIGAGVSALHNAPLWDDFADAMVDQLEKLIGLSFLEREQLKAIKDPRRKASIVIDLVQDINKIDFRKILHSDETQIGEEAYRYLTEMDPVFVTTNFDTRLDIKPVKKLNEGSTLALGEHSSTEDRKRKTYCWPHEFTTDKLNECGSTIHLHGSCIQPASMVISLRDYIDHYSKEHIKIFLKEMFKNKNVLFIGYGLAELEIIEPIIKNIAPNLEDKKSQPRHYLLYACRSTEETQVNFLKRFFDGQCGIGLIPYCMLIRKVYVIA